MNLLYRSIWLGGQKKVCKQSPSGLCAIVYESNTEADMLQRAERELSGAGR